MSKPTYECEVENCPNEGTFWHKMGFLCCLEHHDYEDHDIDNAKTDRNAKRNQGIKGLVSVVNCLETFPLNNNP